MSDVEKTGEVSKKTLIGQRTYRVSARMIENFPQVSFFVSPVAHRLYHLQQTLFPDFAGKDKIDIENLPKGFRLMDFAITKQFNRDLANFARFHFSSATQEELISAKFLEAKSVKKMVSAIVKE